jgi:hypothetical protein
LDGRTFYYRAAKAIAQYWLQELEIHPNVHYRIREAVNGPRIIALHVVVNPRYAAKIIGMSEQLSMAAGLDKQASIRIDRGRAGALSVEIPKPSELWYNVSITALPRRGGLRATVGLDTEHRPTLVDFSNPLTPHALIAGTTGSGKTNAQRLMVYDLASQNEPNEVQFLLIDTRKRGSGWRPFEHLSHLAHPVITDDGTALRALAWAVTEIDRRAASEQTRPRVFICLDETQALLEQEQFVKPISDLSAVGREFGIHLLAAIQNPTAKQLGDATIKRNLTTRLVGKTDSAEAARVAAGIGGTGAERLMGAGDFLLVQPDGVRRLTTALLTERDTDRLAYAESPGYLDLAAYEDIDHVSDVADVKSLRDTQGKRGRKPDPLDLGLVGRLVGMLATGQEIVAATLANQLGLYVGKVERHIEAADDVLNGLTGAGYSVDFYRNGMK